MEIADIFSILDSTNVEKHTEKKGQFTYLSWAWAVRELLRVDAQATWEVHEYHHGNGEVIAPYMRTGAGCFVKVTVWSGGIARTQVHPVLDNRNKPIEEPNAFQVNTSIQRCLAKAIALHGLVLYIYAGEDLPVLEPLTKKQIDDMVKMAKAAVDYRDDEDDALVNTVQNKIKNGEVHKGNYDASIAKLKRWANE
jgi:hypothetical protein